MSEEFKADHFINMEELLDTIKEWLINEELYGTLYDDFNRFFDTGAMEEMYYYIKQLQQENEQLKNNNKTLNTQKETAYKIADDYYRESEQLKNNWNELKKWLEELQQEEFDINGFTGVCTEIRINCILNKMQKLEDSNE